MPALSPGVSAGWEDGKEGGKRDHADRRVTEEATGIGQGPVCEFGDTVLRVSCCLFT